MRQIENKMVKRSYNYIKWRWTKSQLKDKTDLKRKKSKTYLNCRPLLRNILLMEKIFYTSIPDRKTNKKRLLQTVITKLKRERQ